jgi:vanillate O-demethylase monooxygenase subunit
MGGDGKTASMPCQRVRGFPAIASYPVHEAHGFVWVWPGHPSQADVALIPQFEWLGNPAFGYGGGLYHIGCDYRLMIDNLMDLTHETYVHSNSIGQKEIDEAPCQTRVAGDHVITERYMEGIEAPPFWKMALRLNGLPDDRPVDRWQICHFTPPSHVMIEVGVALAGNGGYHAPDAVKAASWVVAGSLPRGKAVPELTSTGAGCCGLAGSPRQFQPAPVPEWVSSQPCPRAVRR